MATQDDLSAGVSVRDLADGGMMTGRVGDDDVVLLRHGESLFALGAHCTHYHGPLAEGLVVGDTLRCPLHHACFDIRTGQAVRAPALDPIACWRVERVGDRAFVRERLPEPQPQPPHEAKVELRPRAPDSVVIVGGGAAGLAAADMLRREGYQGALTMFSADDFAPCDRPNLSKDYLAGTASDDWIPLRPPEYYADRRIDLVLNARVTHLDHRKRELRLGDGRQLAYGALLLATGAEPVRLEIPGAQSGQVHYLRTFADSRAIIANAASAKRAVVVGASFIGLEVAASLRARGLEVHVVDPGRVPMERVLGAEVGRFVQGLHEANGVAFHLGATLAHMAGARVTLSDSTTVDADLVVLGVGVRPALALAEEAGLAIDRGVVVDEFLETSAPGVFAAGDIARWPDPHSAERIRVEHWVVAERQGQVAARNILGRRQRFDAVPFFWSQHYDVTINYVGHAESWDSVQVEGSLAARDCAVSYQRAGRTLAVATIGRDGQSLQAESAMESACR
jgi:NADPH-dependent 2,4-dienoyl-CoA reductase/sulfur reductase-like enzyme/nitrite reductase/ring-hydroxylating ferredoxin subunit